MALPIGGYAARRELPSRYVHDFDGSKGSQRVRLSTARCLQEPSPERLAAFTKALAAPTRLGLAAIPPVLETGYDAGHKRLWAARPWRGNSLEDKQTPLPADDVRALATTLRETLEALHSKGYVHGRVLPSRVTRDDDGTWHLFDAGLATFLLGARGLVIPGLAPVKPPTVADDVRGYAEILAHASSIRLEKPEFPDLASAFAFFGNQGFSLPPPEPPTPPPEAVDLPNPFAGQPPRGFVESNVKLMRPRVEALATALQAELRVVDGMFVIPSKCGQIVIGAHGLRSPGLALAEIFQFLAHPAAAAAIFAVLAGAPPPADVDLPRLPFQFDFRVKHGRNLVIFQEEGIGWQGPHTYGPWTKVVGALDTAHAPEGPVRRWIVAELTRLLAPPPRPPAVGGTCRFCKGSFQAANFIRDSEACHNCAVRHLGVVF